MFYIYISKYERSEYHTQLAKVSFDKIFDLTAGVYFHLNNLLRRGLFSAM